MAQIRDSSIIRTPEVQIDPRFSFPDDVVDLHITHYDEEQPESYDDNDNSSLTEVTLDQTIPSSDVLDEPDNASTSLSAPQTLTIISQTVRISPDGTSVVDVVIEVEDVPGAESYELRVTK